LSLALGAVAAGAVAAVLVQPAAQPFLDASRGIDFGRGPFVVGVLVTVLAIALLRPLRWRPNPVAEPPP
jgi:hypothetical protein